LNSAATAAAFISVVMSVARSIYVDVHPARVVPVLVDDLDAAARATAAVTVAEFVAFAAGKAQRPDGQDDD
jgi:uncharacterized protein YciW